MNSIVADEIIKKIKEHINLNDSLPYLSKDRYHLFKISPENFKQIKNIQGDRKIVFIDGGNGEIIKAPNISLQFIRVYANVFLHNKKIDSRKDEFYALITTEKREEIVYTTKLFQNNLLDENRLTFNLYDRTIANDISNISISKIADVIRRFAELSLATKIAEELDEGDIIVLDGELEERYTNENFYIEKLYSVSKKRGLVITAISKTSKLLTQSGDVLSVMLSKKAPFNEWYYPNIAKTKNNNVSIYFVKLHKDSEYVFKIEVYNSQNTDNKIFSLLRKQSQDPVFIGYPYGLIDADKHARISNSELSYIKTKFFARLGNKLKEIQPYLNSLNAHNILDSIS